MTKWQNSAGAGASEEGPWTPGVLYPVSVPNSGGAQLLLCLWVSIHPAGAQLPVPFVPRVSASSQPPSSGSPHPGLNLQLHPEPPAPQGFLNNFLSTFLSTAGSSDSNINRLWLDHVSMYFHLRKK